MQKHSQDLVSLSSIKIIEIVPSTTRATPFLVLFIMSQMPAYLKINPMVQLSIREKDIHNKSNQFYFDK
jgi:hypothetical protein